MTDLTKDTPLDAPMAPAEEVPEILVATDAKYDDPEYMDAMDATCTNLAHQAGTAAAHWTGTSAEEFVHAALSCAEPETTQSTVQSPLTADSGVGTTSTDGALPVDLLPMDALRLDGGTQSRVSINEAVIDEYATALLEGADLPPVIVFFDGSEFWLADGFHRYHAHVQVQASTIPGYIHTGTRRDAVLYSLGANGSHGLPRTKADKRRAVTIALADPEWASWSQEKIAKRCAVSTGFVSKVIAEASLHGEEMRCTKKTVTRNGKTYEQDTSKIGKARKTKESVMQADLEAAEPLPITTLHAALDQDTAAISRVDELLVENAALRQELATVKLQLAAVLDEATGLKTELDETKERLNDIADDLADTLADNEMMSRVFESDDQVKASMVEVARYRAVAEYAEQNLNARAHEFNERAHNVRYWKSRAEKAEKRLAQTG